MAKKEQATELEYLRFFYDRVSDALGPADDEIYDMIKEEFVDHTGKRLPEGYKSSGDEDDDETN